MVRMKASQPSETLCRFFEPVHVKENLPRQQQCVGIIFVKGFELTESFEMGPAQAEAESEQHSGIGVPPAKQPRVTWSRVCGTRDGFVARNPCPFC
jgi:hypothetical protein